jgi:hypothetical protein
MQRAVPNRIDPKIMHSDAKEFPPITTQAQVEYASRGRSLEMWPPMKTIEWKQNQHVADKWTDIANAETVPKNSHM